MKEIKEIVEGFVGVDEEQVPRGIFTALLGTVNERGEEQEEIDQESSVTPHLRVYYQEEFVIVDACYPSAMETDLKRTWKIIQDYLDRVSQFSLLEKEQEEISIPILMFNLMGRDITTSSMMQAKNPVFSVLMSANPGMPVSCIRLLFREEDVDFYEGELGLEEIQNEMEAEEAMESFVNKKQIDRRQQRKEEMEKLEAARKAQM